MTYTIEEHKSIFEIIDEKIKSSNREFNIITHDFIVYDDVSKMLDSDNINISFINNKDVLDEKLNNQQDISMFLVDFDVLDKYNFSLDNIQNKEFKNLIIVFSTHSIDINRFNSLVSIDSVFGIIENYESNKLSFNIMIQNGIKNFFNNKIFFKNANAIDNYIERLKKEQNFSIERVVDQMINFFNQFEKNGESLEFVIIEKNIYSKQAKLLGGTHQLFVDKKLNNKESKSILRLADNCSKEKQNLKQGEYFSYYFSNNTFRELIFVFKNVESLIFLSKRLLNLIVTLNAEILLNIIIFNVKEKAYLEEIEHQYKSLNFNNNKLKYLNLFIRYLKFENLDKNNIKHLFFCRELKQENITVISDLLEHVEKRISNKSYYFNQSIDMYADIIEAIDLIEDKGAEIFLDEDFNLNKNVVNTIRENIILYNF